MATNSISPTLTPSVARPSPSGATSSPAPGVPADLQSVVDCLDMMPPKEAKALKAQLSTSLQALQSASTPEEADTALQGLQPVFDCLKMMSSSDARDQLLGHVQQAVASLTGAPTADSFSAR